MHEEVKSYLDELERLQEPFRQTDYELMDCEDFTTTEYYKSKVPTEALDEYVDIRAHLVEQTRGARTSGYVLLQFYGREGEQ